MKASDSIGIQWKYWRFYKTQFSVHTKIISVLAGNLPSFQHTHTETSTFWLIAPPIKYVQSKKKSTCVHERKAEATTGTNTGVDVETACSVICTITAALHNPLVFESNTPPSTQQAMLIKSLKKHLCITAWAFNGRPIIEENWPSCCDGM